MQGHNEAKIILDEGGELQIVGNKVLLEVENVSDTLGKLKLIIAHPEYKRWARNGVIKAIGGDVVREDFNFSVNDFISFGSAMIGIDLEINCKTYKIVNPLDILAKFEKTNK